jgi:hypothetical protein
VRYDSAKSSVKLVRSAAAMSFELAKIAGRRIAGHYRPERLRRLAGAP